MESLQILGENEQIDYLIEKCNNDRRGNQNEEIKILEKLNENNLEKNFRLKA